MGNLYDDLARLIAENQDQSGSNPDALETENHATEHAPGGPDDLFGAAKTTPVAADLVLIKDSAASNAIATATQAQLFGAAKVTPVAADLVVIKDSENSNEIETMTQAQLFGAAKTTPVAADLIVIKDSESANEIESMTVAQALSLLQTGQEVASDGAVALLFSDSVVHIAASASGTKTITTTSSRPFQVVHFQLVAASGGQYDLALVTGTLTMDAADEAPVVMRNAADTGWLVVALNGATVA